MPKESAISGMEETPVLNARAIASRRSG